ncbi:MAG: hypothetical protein KJ799_14410 [Bacteroidetes bacterium]|nr:hypothetical protein [Bacteroidota bacterium]MBU1680087.1 hypothetical protein [Bacteroidota bacterium]MBU2507898.1 hypothetical protein [Bacteroidota bacterium]
MGQQQILLIMLGFIVVGIAVVVGIDLVNANAVERNREAVINDLNMLAGYAQTYYNKPSQLSGGGNSFQGYTIPTNLQSNANGIYSVTSTSTNQLVINGIGTEFIGSSGGCVQSDLKPEYNITITRSSNSIAKVR